MTNQTVHRPGTVSFQLDRGGPEGERLLIVYNAAWEDFRLELPAGRWIIRADGQWADQHRPAGAEGNWVTVPKCSGMLLLRRRDEPPELEPIEPEPEPIEEEPEPQPVEPGPAGARQEPPGGEPEPRPAELEPQPLEPEQEPS